MLKSNKGLVSIVLTLTLFCPPLSAWASRDISSYKEEKNVPEPLLMLDNYFTHHVLVAEKSTHLLHLFENRDGIPKHIKSYQMATGKKAGDKTFQGDHRTPEGVYFFTEFIPKAKLLERYGPKDGEIYGVGAFVMDYPNPIDRGIGKSGGGIWLHSTNDETRIDKGLDSRGCIVTANNDLKEISQYLELSRSSVVVVHELHYLKESTWKNTRDQLYQTVQSWLEAWRAEDLERYISFYHPKEYRDSRGGVAALKQYKRAVFQGGGAPQINLLDISILMPGDYAMVTFRQDYRSKNINDIGKKTLYLKRNEYYDWKIVSELWSKIPADEAINGTVAFRPSMRFFNDAPEVSAQ